MHAIPCVQAATWRLIGVPLHEPAPEGSPAIPGANPLNDAASAYAIAMVVLIVSMIVGVGALALYLRWRSRHPLPQPESLDQFFEENGEGGEPPSPPASATPEPKAPWEKPANWWRGGEEDSEAPPESR